MRTAGCGGVRAIGCEGVRRRRGAVSLQVRGRHGRHGLVPFTSMFYVLLTVAHLPHSLHPVRRGGPRGGGAGEGRRVNRLLASGGRVRRDMVSLHAEALQVGKGLADGAEGEEVRHVGVLCERCEHVQNSGVCAGQDHLVKLSVCEPAKSIASGL